MIEVVAILEMLYFISVTLALIAVYYLKHYKRHLTPDFSDNSIKKVYFKNPGGVALESIRQLVSQCLMPCSCQLCMAYITDWTLQRYESYPFQ